MGSGITKVWGYPRVKGVGSQWEVGEERVGSGVPKVGGTQE